MDGYVISLVSDDDNSIGYWNGTGVSSNLEDTTFFDTLVSARQAVGNLQTQYTRHTVQLAEATKGIQLKSSTPTTTNVATSPGAADFSV